MKVVAIDFETANETRSSPCSIGLAWIEDGAVARVDHHYIRPWDMRFAPFNIAFHGIGPDHVRDAEEFPAVLDRLRGDLDGALVLAHNASFDISVIRRTCEHYGVAPPAFDYMCTVQVARSVWPNLPSHKLNVVGRHLGLSFKHHDAAGDAYACGQLALAAAGLTGAAGVHDLAARIGLTPGRLSREAYAPSQSRSLPRKTPPPPRPVLPPGAERRLADRTVVFTGQLDTMSRPDAQDLAAAMGARVVLSMSRKVDLVVAGPGAGAKLRTARELGVQVMNEDEWLALVS
jgi:DNA polymerase III epsilon subunit-like protein